MIRLGIIRMPHIFCIEECAALCFLSCYSTNHVRPFLSCKVIVTSSAFRVKEKTDGRYFL